MHLEKQQFIKPQNKMEKGYMDYSPPGLGKIRLPAAWKSRDPFTIINGTIHGNSRYTPGR